MKTATFAVLSLVLATAAAWADDAPSGAPASPAAPTSPARHPPRGHGACRPDVAKFCGEVKPGRGAILACLDTHKDELSAGCKTMLEKAQAHRAGMDKAPSGKDGGKDAEKQ